MNAFGFACIIVVQQELGLLGEERFVLADPHPGYEPIERVNRKAGGFECRPPR
jgi:hypothetical protein